MLMPARIELARLLQARTMMVMMMVMPTTCLELALDMVWYGLGAWLGRFLLLMDERRNGIDEHEVLIVRNEVGLRCKHQIGWLGRGNKLAVPH